MSFLFGKDNPPAPAPAPAPATPAPAAPVDTPTLSQDGGAGAQQRAAGAAIAGNDNLDGTLGMTGAKRKSASRTILG